MNMTLQLTDYDQALLSGEKGEAARLAMSILTRMAKIFRATEMLNITRAHVDGTIYVGDAGMEYAERLAGLDGQVVVPTTLNVSGLDEHHWEDWKVDAHWAKQAHRQMVAYQSMGCEPTWTCAPYQVGPRPQLGQQIAWGESNAIAFANSVCGARTERYPDYLDICAALTGRVPAVGLHLDENRAANLRVQVTDVPIALQRDESFYPVFGYLLGKLAANRVPVITGLQYEPDDDQLKALGAAAASSGNLALFHIVGRTPEAPTLEEACLDQHPDQVEAIEVSLDAIREARRELTTTKGQSLDLVVLGSPHFSLDEFSTLATLVRGKKCHPNVRFVVTSSRFMTALAEKKGDLGTLKAFGGEITVDTCILATPMLPSSIKTLMTNSGKYAYYSPGLLDRDVVFGSLSDCVASAVAGEIRRDESLWQP